MFTVVLFANGRVGINAEHTPVDAMCLVSIFIAALGQVAATFNSASGRAQLLAPPPPLSPSLRPPEVLEWRLGSRTRAAIEQASVEVGSLGADCEVRHLDFLHFGKAFIKRAKLHPDFFMQMAIQLAMFRMHQTFVATYETGHTRAFYHGRTDTVRSLSVESAAFVRAMMDEAASAADKLSALKTACAAHGEQLQRVLTGQGIDRHMLGLYIGAHLRGSEPFPLIFTDKAYKLSGGGGNYRMSTSNVGYTPLFGGFAPMTADGYGVCYAMLESRMNVIVTTWHSCAETSASRMRDTIAQALCDMRTMCISAGAGEAAAASKL